MSRRIRIHAPGGFYHVTSRGNHQRALFHGDEDRQTLNSLVTEAVERFGIRVHGYCWMTNHVHLLIQAGEKPLGKAMQLIKMNFARYMHGQIGTRGHWFEKRYGDMLIKDDRYFLATLRYIHNNPVEAHMVADPVEYEWSSHRAYLGLERPAFLTTEFALSLLSKDMERAQAIYRDELMQYAGSYSEDPYSVSKREQAAAGDAEETKVSRLLIPEQRLAKLSATIQQRRRSAVTLPELADRLCAKYSIDAGLLCSPSRVRSLCRVRAELAALALEGRIASLDGVGRFLDRDQSVLSRAIARYKPPIDRSLL